MLAPAQVNWSWELRTLRHFEWIRRNPRHPRLSSVGLTFSVQAAHLRAICSELDIQFSQKTTQCPRRSRRPPWHPKASQSDPRAARKDTTGAQSRPTKEGVKWHPKEAKVYQNCIHINKIYANSRSTTIQRPGRIIDNTNRNIAIHTNTNNNCNTHITNEG